MSSYMPPWQRRPPAQPKPETREPTLRELALAEILAEGEPEPPFGGWRGEFITGADAEPPPAPPAPFVIPPPPWSEHYVPDPEPEPATLEEEPGYPPPQRRPAA